jgi:hypothetical protein
VDVKFHNDQWKKVESSIQGLTQSGYFQLGQGIFSSLEDISKNLEDLQDKIARYDSDGVVSFSHTNHKSKYKALNEDYAVLQEYSKKVGDLIEEKIDQPFYEDMDEFVETMRDATISNYSTTNRIDAKEEREYKDETGTYKFELDKKEVTINDLFSGDNYYADKMMQEFTIWKQQSDKSETNDISYDDYRDVRMNSGAFQYKSIEDGQLSTEFWVNLGILGGVTIATILVPPAGAPLVAGLSGAGLGVLEASSAVTGKDWITQRDIAADERAIRGATSILGAVPIRAGAGAFRSFGSNLSATSVKDIAAVSKVTGKNLTNTAAKQGLTPHEMLQLTKQTDTLTDGANQTNSIMRNNTVSLMEWKEAKAIKQLQDAQYSKTDQLLKGTGTDGIPIMSKSSGSPNSVMYGSEKVDTAGVGVRASGSVGRVAKGTGKSTQGARYGERKISDQTYGKLRRASPSSKIQKEVNKNIDDIIGTEDFALPGKIIDKKLHADHIVSLEKIARMEDFDTLTYKQQKDVANFVENFIGLSEAANTSKGSKSFADWYIYKKENIPVNAEFREKMILKEKELEIEIQKMIDEFNIINKRE